MLRRREFLVGTAALAAEGLLAPAALRSARNRTDTFERLRPSDPAWPDEAAWNALDQAVGGNLIRVEPLFGACRTDTARSGCADARSQMSNPFYIGDQAAGTQVSGWLGAWISSPSAYAVRARNAADVAAAVNFARDRRLRLVVKGGGHSYQGTSNAPDSLLVWTRAMNDIVIHDAFVQMGGDQGSAGPAVSLGAGAMWIDAYDAVTTRAGRYVQGGGCASVGVAGLIQSGGFGSFSKGFGLAAGGLLEAEIVTADGNVRTVNAGRDPDLFWALKGGGGGNWGVVTRLTVRTHDLPQYFGAARGRIRAHSDEAFLALIRQFLAFYAERLMNPHWGEHIVVGPERMLEISMVCQGLPADEVRQTWKPFFDSVRANSQLSIVSELGGGSGASRHWWDVAYRLSRGSRALRPDPRPGAPAAHAWWEGDEGQVGAFLYAYQSAWLPADLLRAGASDGLAAALAEGSRSHAIELHFNKGLAGAPEEARRAALQTAMNPEVVDAFALAIVADGGAPVYPGLGPRKLGSDGPDTARSVAQAMRELRRIAPRAGSYVSESDYFELDWQRSHWAVNYERLREVKRRYDPDGLFYVHHGVGSEAWSNDGFRRLKSD